MGFGDSDRVAAISHSGRRFLLLVADPWVPTRVTKKSIYLKVSLFAIPCSTVERDFRLVVWELSKTERQELENRIGLDFLERCALVVPLLVFTNTWSVIFRRKTMHIHRRKPQMRLTERPQIHVEFARCGPGYATLKPRGETRRVQEWHPRQQQDDGRLCFVPRETICQIKLTTGILWCLTAGDKSVKPRYLPVRCQLRLARRT